MKNFKIIQTSTNGESVASLSIAYDIETATSFFIVTQKHGETVKTKKIIDFSRACHTFWAYESEIKGAKE